MKSIDKIHIEFVKGIVNETYSFSILPFMPTFLVAPNGHGKSSLAIAFDSLNRDRLKLEEKNLHFGDTTKTPVLELTITNENNERIILKASDELNQISKYFQIAVIKGPLKPVANLRNIQGNYVASPAIEIDDIYIIENIPEKFELPYQVTQFRTSINDNRQIWVDISLLLKNRVFINKLENLNVLGKFQLKGLTKLVDSYVSMVRELTGTKDQIISIINDNHLSITDNTDFNSLCTLISQFVNCSVPERILISIQIINLYKADPDLFLKLFRYKRYCSQKEMVVALFKSFKATWKDITPREINITKRIKGKNVIIGRNFGISFPKATDISNGERDVVCFMANLLRIQYNFKDKPSILIIDEVFDYLDDANLVAVQYYISVFIDFFQKTKSGIPFFPIILTHLNPYYFKNYFFSNQKVHYLLTWKGVVDRSIESLIITRNNSKDAGYSDSISSHFLHFNTVEIDMTQAIENEFVAQKLNNFKKEICDSSTFKKKIQEYFDNYICGRKNYDPISVCIAVRLNIEEKVYSKLDSDQKAEFIKTKTTVAKLNYVKENTAVQVPESFFLLATLYNELLHLKKNNDNSSPIFLKLNNLTIKKFIKEIMNPL